MTEEADLIERSIKRISLKEFAATGNFGPVTVGFTPSALELAFGPPDATGGTSRRYRRPSIWKYGDVEFFFDRQSQLLTLIHIDHFNGTGATASGWDDLEIEPWVIKKCVSRESFLEAVYEARLTFDLRREPQSNQEVIAFASGVEVGFVYEPDEFSDSVGLAWIARVFDVS